MCRRLSISLHCSVNRSVREDMYTIAYFVAFYKHLMQVRYLMIILERSFRCAIMGIVHDVTRSFI